MSKSLSKTITKLVEEVISNDDLLGEVVMHLPAKSLVRFKCVSKHWRSLISDPEFCSKHTRLNPTSHTLGFYFGYKSEFGLESVSLQQANGKDLPALKSIKKPGCYGDWPTIVQACNGLLLCSYTCIIPYSLPQHNLPNSERYHSAYLVFNPSKSPHFTVVLLGVTVSKHDTIRHSDDDYNKKDEYCYGPCYEIFVYSSETGVWKRMYFRAPHGSHLDYKAVCNGSLHWITRNKFHFRFEVDTSKLILKPMPRRAYNFGHGKDSLFWGKLWTFVSCTYSLVQL